MIERSLYMRLTFQLFKEFFRNKLILFFVFLFPLMFLVIFEVGGKLQNNNPALKVAFSLDEKDNFSVSLFSALEGHSSINVLQLAPEAALEQLKNGKVNMIIVPSASDENLSQEKYFKVLARGSGAQHSLTLIIESVISRVLNTHASDGERIDYIIENIEGANALSFKVFVIPGIIALALMQIGLFGTAAQITSQREMGVFRHLLISPMPKPTYVMAHITLRFIIIVLQVALILSVMVFVFGEKIYGNWVLLTFAAISGGMMLASLGYLIGGLAINQQASVLIVQLVMFSGMFFGQVIMDLSENEFMSKVILLNPVTYVSDLCRQIVLDTEGVIPLWVNFVVIYSLLAIFSLTAIKTFRFSTQDN